MNVLDKSTKLIKKKPLTEKQMIQIMTKRRACIEKFRKTMKKSTMKAPKKSSKKDVVPPSNLVEQEFSNEQSVGQIEKPKKKRTKKNQEPDESVESVESVEPVEPLEEESVSLPVPEEKPKKKRTKKIKQSPEEVPVGQPDVPLLLVPEEKPKKKRTKKTKKTKESEEPINL